MVEYKIFEHMSYDWMIAAYFFLGGLGVGSFFCSVAANYWRKEFKPLAKAASVITPLAIAAGLLLLLVDLGQPLRFWRLFLTFVPTSALSWGIWFLNIFFGLSAIYSYLVITEKDEQAKKIGYLGLPFGVLAATYTAVLLGQAPGRVLWHSPLLPVLFLVGGLISGLALVMFISVVKEKNALTEQLGKLLAGFLILELGLVLIEMITLLNGSIEAVAMAKHLLTGQYAFLFWIAEIAFGAIVPIYMLLKSKTSSAYATASLLTLLGMFTMRYIVVVGGQVATF